ncbi:GNAT family N-acetyltransferase [Acanthopleuribacter pedis]|uniref:GNAT family N-acetyltransferase n=1 Tax=Acanthopleuribacter pedis TaxID=442870 RepID=A0A8J7Q9P6_9BACT|nr:GNAT family N-acetyltransferase [Acanthopleuribacter pedis]MBO1321256.1 GNAT family N-acetyltransferase [Acanthopleuribacter pedis]
MFLKEYVLTAGKEKQPVETHSACKGNLRFVPVDIACFSTWLKLNVHDGQQRHTFQVFDVVKQGYWNREGGLWDIYLIFFEEQAIGTFTCSFYPGQPEILNFGGFLIDHNYQGKGFGCMALQKLIQWVPRLYPERKQIVLDVDPRNRVAVRLYRKLGFRYRGWRPPFFRIYERDLA